MWEMRRPGCLVDNPRVTSKHRDARLGIRVPLCDTRERDREMVCGEVGLATAHQSHSGVPGGRE